MIDPFEILSADTLDPLDIAANLLPYARKYLDKSTIDDLESVVASGGSAYDTPEHEAALASIHTAIEGLQDHCAPYCFIGATEGDGAALMCQPMLDSVQYDMADGEILGVSDLSEVPLGYTGYALHVNDHGNATLVSCAGDVAGTGENAMTEIWAVV